MLALKYLLMLLGVGLFGSAGTLVVYDVYVSERLRRLIKQKANSESEAPVNLPPLPLAPVRWKLVQQLAAAAILPLLLALSIVVIPDGISGSAHQPDLGRASRHAVPRGAHRHAADR